MTPITGNTYPVRDALRALGGKWDARLKAWLVPDEKAGEARKIVADAPEAEAYRPTKCLACGHKATGRYGDVIYRSGECRDCFEERRMGY